jgi:hypothetical protein
MFDLQYNANSHRPDLRPVWKHSRRRNTREELESYCTDYEEGFRRYFEKPTGLQWRIVEVQGPQD